MEIFLKYGVEIGIIKEEQKQETEKYWKDVIFQVIKNHELSNIYQDPAIMYLMARQELVESNKCNEVKLKFFLLSGQHKL